jgi:hypothetical protein
VGEAVREAAAARLAIRVLQFDAVDDRRGLDRELGRRLDQLLLQGSRRGDDLERRSRWLRSRERDAGEPADRARLRIERRDTAEAAGERGGDGLLHVHVDRRAHRLGGLGLGLREHAGAGAQLATGGARQLLLEDPLEAGRADRRIRLEAAPIQRGAFLLERGRGEHPDDLGSRRAER